MEFWPISPAIKGRNRNTYVRKRLGLSHSIDMQTIRDRFSRSFGQKLRVLISPDSAPSKVQQSYIRKGPKPKIRLSASVNISAKP